MSFYFEYKKVIPLNFSASLSYYLMLALVPSFLLIYIFTDYVLNDLIVIEEIINIIFPSSYSKELISFLKNNHLKFSPYLLIVIIICLNIISNGVVNLTKSLDYIFSIHTKRNIKIKSILLSLLMIIIESVLLFIATLVNYYFNVFAYLRFTILFCIILFCFIFIYKFLPSKPFMIKDIINYSVIGSFLISILILGFNVFIDYYSNMDLYYGPFSIIVSILILFKFISDIFSFIFFIEYKKMKNTSLL